MQHEVTIIKLIFLQVKDVHPVQMSSGKSLSLVQIPQSSIQSHPTTTSTREIDPWKAKRALP